MQICTVFPHFEPFKKCADKNLMDTQTFLTSSATLDTKEEEEAREARGCADAEISPDHMVRETFYPWMSAPLRVSWSDDSLMSPRTAFKESFCRATHLSSIYESTLVRQAKLLS